MRDRSGTPILPVIEHFGGPTAEEEADGEGGASRRSRRAAGFPPPAETAAAPGGARERRARREDTERRPAGRTFLDRSPPPECVETVLHRGCTARKVSAAGACIFALVREGWSKGWNKGCSGLGGFVIGSGLCPRVCVIQAGIVVRGSASRTLAASARLVSFVLLHYAVFLNSLQSAWSMYATPRGLW